MEIHKVVEGHNNLDAQLVGHSLEGDGYDYELHMSQIQIHLCEDTFSCGIWQIS